MSCKIALLENDIIRRLLQDIPDQPPSYRSTISQTHEQGVEVKLLSCKLRSRHRQLVLLPRSMQASTIMKHWTRMQ